jgi:hypothetical protein
MRLYKKCLNCGKKLIGRTDKKYCDPQCKSSHQYKREKEQPERFYNKVDNQLRLNRKLLKEYNKAGRLSLDQKYLQHWDLTRNSLPIIGRTKKEMFTYSYMNLGF